MPKDTTAKVTKAKQDDLPEIAPSDRKIPELEELGDTLADLEDEKSAINERVKEANENLVVAMKKRDRTFYSRQTWGSILLKETQTSAKVKKAHAGGGEADE